MICENCQFEHQAKDTLCPVCRNYNDERLAKCEKDDYQGYLERKAAFNKLYPTREYEPFVTHHKQERLKNPTAKLICDQCNQFI